jgi:uncharacterized protein (DUF58 family)
LLEVYCEGRRPIRGWTLQDQGDGFQLTWQILHSQPNIRLRLRRTVTIERRGRHLVEPLRASSRYPFGLVHASIDLAPAEELIVIPKLGTIHREYMKQWLWHAVLGDGRSRTRTRHWSPHEGDLHGLRDFRPGDSPRWIHWRTSARRNQLLVREFEDNIPANLVLVVEPWLPEGGGSDTQRERLEQVISLAATICREWCREAGGRMILVVASAEPIIMEGATGAEHALRTMQALAVQMGSPALRNTAWVAKLSRSVLSIPMLVLSSTDSFGLAGLIGAMASRAIASVEVFEPIGWYEPPVGV